MNESKPVFGLAETLLPVAEARLLLGSGRQRSGGRVMDVKAQIVAEFANSVRKPGYFPPLPELRQQLRTLVDLLDEPAPDLPAIEDISVPGPAGDIPARVYRPATDAGALPVLAYFHGGGFVQGDLETHHGLCARLALWSGALVVAFDYRLAPEHKFPAAVEDCLAAYYWLRSEGASIGADPARVAVAGDSAGGNLSAVICQQALGSGNPPPTFQVLIYPAVDLAMGSASHAAMVDAAVIPRDRIDWYMEQYLNSAADKADLRASPLQAESFEGLPPALIISGGFDPLRDEGEAYAQRLQAAGVATRCSRYDGMIHGFFGMSAVLDQGKQAVDEAAAALHQAFSAT